MYATSFHTTGPLKSPGCTVQGLHGQKAATNMESCFATMPLFYSLGGHILLTKHNFKRFLMASSYVVADCNQLNTPPLTLPYYG